MTGERGRREGVRDPRTIITPEAFSIAPDLLGLPLATPSRRLAAILIDLAVIGIVYAATRSFFFIVFLVAAALLLRASYRGIRESDFIGRAFRMSVGCLGAMILLSTLTAVLVLRGGDEPGSGIPDPGGFDGDASTDVVEPGLRDLVRGGTLTMLFRRAVTPEEAGRAGTALARALARSGMAEDDVEEFLREVVPAEAPWSRQADSIVREAVRASGAVGTAAAVKPEPEPGEGAAEGEEGEAETAEGEAQTELARDTPAAPSGLLAEQDERIRELEEELARERRRTAALEEGERGGFLSAVRDLVDELGFGFGWAAIYFTLIMPWTGGRTVGKRLLGLRVLQLDGSPINWWEAFERAGGYAAGFATGLLGFAQVYWDPNRQAIHDKVAGTVVVRDGLPPVPGPWRPRRADPVGSSPAPPRSPSAPDPALPPPDANLP